MTLVPSAPAPITRTSPSFCALSETAIHHPLMQ
jgi:hypothetical protein